MLSAIEDSITDNPCCEGLLLSYIWIADQPLGSSCSF